MANRRLLALHFCYFFPLNTWFIQNCPSIRKNSSISVSMTDDWIVQVKGMTTSRTKCNLYFKKGENFITYIQNLSIQTENSGLAGLYSVDHSTSDITWEGTDEQVNNLKKKERRYAGKNYDASTNLTGYVHNYVNIDGQTWRVIGLVNTPEGQRIKLVKDESIGKSSWDTSASNVNSGYGINEWSTSDLMKLLNFGYDRNELESSDGVIQKNAYVDNSLYWNGKSGQCYSSEKNAVNDCNFTDNKISENLKKMIEEVTWNTGSILASGESTNTVKKIYEYERSSNIGKICKNSVWCNDKEERTTNWKGEVSLIYASDYGYATSGGTDSNRMKCLDSDILTSWANDCYMNDWLYSANNYWTLSPYQHLTLGSIVLNVLTSGYLYKGYNVGRGFDIYPSVYLSSSVLLINGDGSFDNMFRLSL